MTKLAPESLILLAKLIEIIGATALIIGFVVATIKCLRIAYKKETKIALETYRQSLGRVILIGLEVLVAATIIKTVALDPTITNLALLAITVIIRTLLSWTTVLELTNHWPWQHSKRGKLKISKDHCK